MLPISSMMTSTSAQILYSAHHAYQVLSLLAESTNSVVYLASARPLDTQHGTICMDGGEQLVVLKKLPRALSACYELELHRRVHDHPYILPLLDYIVDVDAIYLVLEYCSAGDLFDAILEIHSNPTLSQVERERWALRTFRELVHAVHWCHQRGVWHRDIKPENILLTKDGHVQLTDFGLATELPRCDERGKGSLFYMAPELLASPTQPFGTGQVDSTCADVWSLGILLLNMLGGRNPWPCAAYQDEAFQIYLAYPEELRVAFSLTDEAWFVIERMLAVDPRFRPSIEQILDWIELVDRWMVVPESDAPHHAESTMYHKPSGYVTYTEAEQAELDQLALELSAEIEAEFQAASSAVVTSTPIQVSSSMSSQHSFSEEYLEAAVAELAAVTMSSPSMDKYEARDTNMINMDATCVIDEYHSEASIPGASIVQAVEIPEKEVQTTINTMVTTIAGDECRMCQVTPCKPNLCEAYGPLCANTAGMNAVTDLDTQSCQTGSSTPGLCLTTVSMSTASSSYESVQDTIWLPPPVQHSAWLSAFNEGRSVVSTSTSSTACSPRASSAIPFKVGATVSQLSIKRASSLNCLSKYKHPHVPTRLASAPAILSTFSPPSTIVPTPPTSVPEHNMISAIKSESVQTEEHHCKIAQPKPVRLVGAQACMEANLPGKQEIDAGVKAWRNTLALSMTTAALRHNAAATPIELWPPNRTVGTPAACA